MGKPSVCGDLSGDTQSEEGWVETGDVETLETAMRASCWIQAFVCFGNHHCQGQSLDSGSPISSSQSNRQVIVKGRERTSTQCSRTGTRNKYRDRQAADTTDMSHRLK